MNKFKDFQRKLNDADNLEELLDTEAFPREPKDKIRDLLNNEDSTSDISFAGLTFGDFIYDALRVNPLVIKGVDFSRSADLGNVFKFSLFSEDIADLSGSSLAGNINQMKGFVGERYVGQQLQSSGHEVEYPDNPNNPGYDLIVDGQPFQVKTTLDASLVQEHLDKYPKIPVFVNEEGRFEGIDAVIDKDLTAAKLGRVIRADEYYIITDIDQVYLNFGSENQSPIPKMTDTQAKKYQEEGHFKQGSMWPKIRSAIHFLKHHGKKVIITNIDNIQDAIDGKAGTTIVKE